MTDQVENNISEVQSTSKITKSGTTKFRQFLHPDEGYGFIDPPSSLLVIYSGVVMSHTCMMEMYATVNKDRHALPVDIVATDFTYQNIDGDVVGH